MCKKNLLTRIKNMSKLGLSKINLQSNAHKNIQNPPQPNQNIDKSALQKIKQQSSKLDQMREYTEKLRQAAQSKSNQLAKNTQETLNQYKDKIINEETIRNKKQALNSYIDKAKQKIEEGQQTITQKTQELSKSTNEYKSKAKQSLQGYSSKIKENIKETLVSGQQTINKKAEQLKQKTKEFDIVSKGKDKALDLAQKLKLNTSRANASTSAKTNQPTPKIQVAPKKQVESAPVKPPAVQEQPPQNKQKQQSEGYTPFWFAQRILQRIKKTHDQTLAQMIMKKTQNIFIRLLSSLYWRALFLIAFGILLWKSPDFIRQGRQFWKDMKKHQLETQKHKAEMQTMRHAQKVDIGVNTEPQMQQYGQFSLFSSKSF